MRRFVTGVIVLLLVTAGVGPAVATTAQPTADASTPSAAAVENQHDPAQTASTNNTTVTILSYNDIQTAIVQNGTTPRLATLIQQRQAAHDNPTVLVGGGDEVSPHALSPISQWRAPTAVLNELDPDAEAIGNHDLDFGFEAVGNFTQQSEFPWVMANIVQEGSGEPIPGTEPYTVVEKQGVRVGVIGIADDAIKGKTAVDFDEKGYEVQNHVSVARQYATNLTEQQNVDVVVVAAHVGVPESKEIANGTENVDVIVTGDDEIRYEPTEVSGTIVTEAQAQAEYLSEVNLTVSNGNVTAWNGDLLTVNESVPKDDTVSSIIAERRDAGLSTVLGTTAVELDSRFSSNYHDETALGNMITDAFRWETGADVAITNAGGIRSNSVYGPGNVTAGDAYSMLPFGNTLVTVELTGAEIKQLLASQVVTLESDTGQQYGAEPQLQVNGITYEYVAHEGTNNTIRDTRIEGEPLLDNETYTVTVNSYMKGWDGSVLENATVVSQSQKLYGTVLTDYIKAKESVSPEDHNRIRRIDTELGTQSVTVDREGSTEIAVDLPDTVESVETDTLRAATLANTTIEPTNVTVGSDTLTATFEDSDLANLADDGGHVELYAAYNDTRYQRVYFNHSVLNAELNATVDTGSDDADSDDSNGSNDSGDSESDSDSSDNPGSDGDSSDSSDDSESDTDDGETTTGGSGPGFGVIATVVAALVAVGLGRRQV